MWGEKKKKRFFLFYVIYLCMNLTLYCVSFRYSFSGFKFFALDELEDYCTVLIQIYSFHLFSNKYFFSCEIECCISCLKAYSTFFFN